MSTSPMPQMPDDPENDGQDVQAELEDLEARVSAIEAKLGMSSPQDDQEDPLKSSLAMTKGALGS